MLRSANRWTASDEGGAEETGGNAPPPAFHIGDLSDGAEDFLEVEASVPWEPSCPPSEKFSKLVDAVVDYVDETGSRRQDSAVADLLDNYLGMLWGLGLSCPLPYSHTHPLDLTEDDGIEFYRMPNVLTDRPEPLCVPVGTTLGEAAGLAEVRREEKDDAFVVEIDTIELRRPIRFTRLPSRSKAAWTTPLMFVGGGAADFSGREADSRGGDSLRFWSYLFWAPAIRPKEHNGVLVRVHEASGTGFDPDFMHYEVSEQRRLTQISSEIFVSKGLESALNIDRESYNYSHPHYRVVARWLHASIRRLTNIHKELGREAREAQREREATAAAGSRDEAAWFAARRGRNAGDDVAPREARIEKTLPASPAGLHFRESAVLPPGLLKPDAPRAEKQRAVQAASSIARVLDAFGVLDDLSRSQQADLVQALVRVFVAGS